MDVPEQGVLGNNSMLATIGKHGELRYLFWPTIDYPQHIRGSLPGVFYKSKDMGGFNWLTDSPWSQKQEYITDTNIIHTLFAHKYPNLEITLKDAVLPDSNTLLRQFSLQNISDNEAIVR